MDQHSSHASNRSTGTASFESSFDSNDKTIVTGSAAKVGATVGEKKKQKAAEPAPVTSSFVGRNTVTEEKKEATEETANNRTDDAIDRKLKDKSKRSKEKRKMARKTSLMDDELDELDDILQEDPIVGLTVGQTAAEKKLQELKDLMDKGMVKARGKNISGITATVPAQKTQSSPAGCILPASMTCKTAMEEPLAPEIQSSPSGCILPAANGEPVVVGCASTSTGFQ